MLRNYSDIPAYLHEPFVWTGYRQPSMEIQGCVRSIFEWHNESINIWTHLASALYFWILASRGSLTKKTSKANDDIHYKSSGTMATTTMLRLYCTTQAAVFTASFIAHTFSPCARTEHQYQQLWRLDWSMIAVAMLGVTLVLVHYSPLAPARKRCWMQAFVTTLLAMVVLVNQPFFTRLPTILKALGALFPIPTLLGFMGDMILQHHRDDMGKGLGSSPVPPFWRQFLWQAMAGPLLLAAIGLAIYASHVPERWYPEGHSFGSVVLSSHNIHHLWTTAFSIWMLHKAQSVLPLLQQQQLRDN